MLSDGEPETTSPESASGSSQLLGQMIRQQTNSLGHETPGRQNQKEGEVWQLNARVQRDQPATTTSSLALQRVGPEPELRITWLGSATMLISCMGLTVLTDPCFGVGETAFVMADPNEMFDLAKGPNIKSHRRLTPFKALEIGSVDHMLLSHMHEDHFDQKAGATLPKTLPTIVPPHDAATLAGKGFINAAVMDWQNSKVIEKENVSLTIKALPAEHSENPEIARLLGKGNGYWLEFRSGDWRKTVYWSGDTFPTQPVLEALKPFGSPDIFIPHMGGVGQTGSLGQISMGASHVMSFAEALNPAKIIPIHHSTYALYLDPIHELASAVAGKRNGLDLVSEGTTVTYV